MPCIIVFVQKLLQCAFRHDEIVNRLELCLDYNFQNLDMEEVSRLTHPLPDQNMLLNILINRPVHYVAEPMLLPKTTEATHQVSLSPS